MPNMLNQFYKYLVKKLIAFLEQEELSGGERYYLQFDSEEEAGLFYDILNHAPNVADFSYQHHENSSPYETFGIKINDILVIVAATINHVTPDFLVTLRNKVGEQKDKFQNTALLCICHETLDSIRGGNSDLQKEGMPFHVKTITQTLEQEIEKSPLTKAEKAVAHYYLQKKLDNMMLHPQLADFAEVLALLEQGRIKDENYAKLGLFKDRNLDQYSQNQMKKRLEENHRFFEQVQHIHEYENLDELEKLFDDQGAKKLKRDDWKDLEFSFVKESNEKYKLAAKKSLEYIESNKKKTEEGLPYWEKPQRMTKAGQRKRHIIVFNPDALKEINLTFEFDEHLKKEYIHKKSEKYAVNSGKKLKVKLPHNPGEISFFRIRYKHKNETKSAYEFNIAIVECHPEFLKPVQTVYEIKEREQRIVIHNNGENIKFGATSGSELFVEEQDETIELSPDMTGLEISSSSPAWIDDSLLFNIKLNDFVLPIKVVEEASNKIPVLKGKQVYKYKREKQRHFIYENGKLQMDTELYPVTEDFKTFLNLERKWIEEEMRFAEKTSLGLKKKEMAVDAELEERYLELLRYYKENDLLPSLAYLDGELKKLSESYVDAFNQSVQAIEENSILADCQKNLFLLGMIQDHNKIYLTPLHPLNVAYQLAVMEQLDNEKIDYHILDRLRPNNLLPYIYGRGDVLYRPVNQQTAVEWVEYEPNSQVSVGESSVYMANVIEEKLNQFVEHFQFLFLEGSRAPLKVNIINIINDEEVLKGIFNFVKNRIEKCGLNQIIPVDVALYQNEEKISAFELFSKYDANALKEKFDLYLESNDLDPVDMLRIIRENIRYYKMKDDGNYHYAHISFYKMVSQDNDAKDNADQIDTGISLNGLLSALTSVKGRQNYRTGFGVKHILNKDERLIQTAICLNELAANLQNEGNNPYRKNESIVTLTSTEKEEKLNALYDSSYWVTFIDPNVGLEYFKKTDRDLLIIHYSDQYTSSNQYDAITVTDKTAQFRHIIKQYLEDESVVATDEQINSAIRTFNTINGEWLLKIVGSKGQFSREKLSIISAIKYSLSFLDTKDIIWVPISLEEILRVAGVVNLTKSGGIFSAKNLGVTGSTSDDLLLIGLEMKDDEIYMHYYPVEVKVGFNTNSVITKAKEQINTTRKLLDKELARTENEGRLLFKNSFYRNFFVEMFLANARKFVINDLWPEKEFHLIEQVKARLLNDDYEIGDHLRPFIGKGMVLSFKKDAAWRAARMDEDVLVLELAEEDAYSGVVEDIETIRNRIHDGKTDINPDDLLANRYNPEQAVTEEGKQDNGDQDKTDHPIKEIEPVEETEQEIEPQSGSKPSSEEMKPQALRDVRILLGTVEGSTHKLYWEYTHPELANRHLLISGKSGQGKTYFIQCLLLELAAQNISSLIFDYTGGFTNSKLEPEFKEFLGGKIEQIFVAKDKFPVNPFKRNQKELDEGVYIDEDFSDVAERMKSVFGAVYKDLGIQQLNAIYQAIIRGLNKYGDGINLQMLRDELVQDSSGPAKTALSQLNPLIDKDPFDQTKKFDWADFIKQKGKINIIQLNGFAADIQKVITEFILWDLWYYQLQHGNQHTLLPVVLDEAQNLDLSEKSPSAKILTEGRKFGWSGWFATQFLKGFLPADEISRLQMATQKIYFQPPENEISSIAANFGRDQASKREWERKLTGLNKGQCVYHGPVINREGKLVMSEPVIINITSLDERIKQIKEM